MVDYKSIEREVWTLTEEGQELAESGSHEARVFDAVPAGQEGITIPDLQVSIIEYPAFATIITITYVCFSTG
jgi:hypothetical protein